MRLNDLPFVIGIVVLFLFPLTNIFSQSISPSKVLLPVGFNKLESLKDVPIKPPELNDGSWRYKTVKNKVGFMEEFNVDAEWKGPDPVLQNNISANRALATVGQNFAGVNNVNGYAPPDTDGDVGLTHYMQMVNASFQIWDKKGTSLYGPVNNSTLWDGFVGPWTGTNNGDPIVLYDEYSDRWIASQFALPNYPNGPFYELIAVSETSDPTGAWYQYAYEFTDMPDYPKFGVWPDGYYFTINQFASGSLSWAGGGVCILDRSSMISGDPNAQMLFFDLGLSYGSLLPADADGPTAPPAGSPNYIVSLTPSSLLLFEADVDWVTTANTTVSLVSSISVQSFSWSGMTINQPGTAQTLDQINRRLMYRLQYRNFGDYEVMLTNHTVNADGNGQAGVRWYELRNTGSGWSMYQQGTYAPADGDNRWMASVAMNGNGDIGLGYTVSSSTTYPSIRFAGQTAANTGTGLFDIDEASIVAGAASQTGVSRWGDYSMISIDPSDDETFWYTSEYSTGGWAWRTQIASFDFGTVAENLNLRSITLTNGEEGCYDATDTITVEGSGTTVEVQSGGTATFIAGGTILLKPGFHSHSGSATSIYITTTSDYCSSLPPLIATPDTVVEEALINPELYVNDESNINIYPNPTTGNFTIDFMGKITTADILLLNFQGQQLMEQQCKEQLKKDIDISHLPGGMYIIVIKTEEKIVTRKIIKNY